MTISTLADLLRDARKQGEPQRLLFVFAVAELSNDLTPEQRARFDAGQGGALTPLMCVDKTPDELPGFDALVTESREFGRPWTIVFVAALACHAGRSPTSAQAKAPLRRMVELIRSGSLGGFPPSTPAARRSGSTQRR